LLRKIVEQPISICPPALDKGKESLAERRAKILFKVSFPLSYLCLIDAVISSSTDRVYGLPIVIPRG
jgi:hypothetical protein